MKKKMKMVVDIMMLAAMPVLMAYELVSAALHEWLGIAIFLLFLLHHGLNWKWHKNILKGRYSAVRFWSLSVNMALLVLMLVIPASGLAMAKYVPAVSFMLRVSDARILHLSASYWCYVLMGIHVGIHGGMIGGAGARKNTMSRLSGWKRVLLYSIAVSAMFYGLYAFMHRQFGSYMFLRSQFAFYDFSEPLIWIFLDYLAIMWLSACIGFYFTMLLKWSGRLSRMEK